MAAAAGGLRLSGMRLFGLRLVGMHRLRRVLDRHVSRLRDQKVAVSVVFVLAMFMTIMDTTIVNVALPTLARQFGVRAAATDTIVVGFLVSLAVFMPASGWLGDRFGTKRVLLAALAIFTAASALCGVADSLGELVAFRVLQGVGGGLLLPVGMAMLWRVYPPHERIAASRTLTIPTAFAPALGPVLGGVLVTELSWRWVFYVNVPIGIGALVFGAVFLVEDTQEAPGRFDAAGFVLAGAGLAGLMYSLSEGPIKGWSTGPVVVLGIVGALLLGVLVAVERRVRQPMLDLELFGDRLFASTSLVILLATTAFLGVLYLVSLFFQDGLGLSALGSGLSTFPEALGVMAGSQVASALYRRVGPRRLITVGLLGVAGSMALMTLIDDRADLWWMRLIMVLLGVSMAHVFVPAQASAFTTISPAATGRASTLFNAQRQIGSAVGVALLTTVLAAAGPFHTVSGRLVAHLTAYHLAFAAAAGIALLGALAAQLVRDSDAALSMHASAEPAAEPVGAVAG